MMKNRKNPKNSPKNIFQRQKIESCKSSKARDAEVSWRSEPCSKGKRTFEVRRRRCPLAKYSDRLLN